MSVAGGVLLALLAGVLNGSFAAPTKYATRWKWENLWAIWATVAFFVVPWSLAIMTVPHLFSVYQNASTPTLLSVIGFGAGYGIAAICFGLGVEAIGIALNFAIALGISTALGSLVPLIALHPEQIFTKKGFTVEAGIAIILLGIITCAVAGRAKEQQLRANTVSPNPARYKAGLAFAIIAGIGSPLVNFGLAFGGPLLAGAAAQGASAATQSNVIWPPLLTATLVPYLAYCSYLWRKNNSLRLFALPGTGSYWWLGALMGVLWMSSIAIFGAASAAMAEMGPVLGWPLFMSSIIIVSNVWGFATGEWRGVQPRTLSIVLVGMLLLILGFCTLAWSFRIA
jgi:L-rhamnose-H+ transport protein